MESLAKFETMQGNLWFSEHWPFKRQSPLYNLTVIPVPVKDMGKPVKNTTEQDKRYNCNRPSKTKALYMIYRINCISRVYHKIYNIRRTSQGDKIVDHSDVVGAAPTTSSFST